MKNLLLSLSVLSMLGFAACKKKDNTPGNSSSVMFVNACAGTTNVNVTVNGTAVSAANNMAFLRNSGYQYIAAGTNTIGYILANLGTPLITGSSAMVANTHYSVFAGGQITNPSLLVVSDDLAAPASGNAKIRFVNLSNDTLSETASVGTTSFATGINSQSSSVYTEIASGSYTIKAGDPANISTVVSVGPQQLSSGKIYTIILTGTQTGTGVSALTLTVINNN